MSFDKKKAMRSAERFLTQGKIRSAIIEYKKVSEDNPKDFSTLNILGDLYIKNSEEAEAIKCFMKVAEYYNAQGFANKAIAIYNKISKIVPDSVEVSGKLAHLYQMRGSYAEARFHYKVLADNYESTGRKIEAIAIWNKIAELDPKNTEVYLKIAETSLNEKQLDKAAEAYTKVGLRFCEQEEYELALEAFKNALEIKQLDLNALKSYVEAQIGLGCADEAVNVLKKMIEEDPYNRDIQYLLVDCYKDLNQTREMESLVVKLVEQEPANYSKLVDLVEIYSKENDLESAVRVLSIASEYLLTGGQAVDFLKWTNEILARNPENIDALRMLVRYHTWQRDEKEVKNSLERLTETAQLTENFEEERETLARLIMMYPQEARYAERMHEIQLKYDFAEVIPESVKSPVDIPKFESFDELNEADKSVENNEGFVDQFKIIESDSGKENEIGFQTFRDIKLEDLSAGNEELETFNGQIQEVGALPENGFQMTNAQGFEIAGEEFNNIQAETPVDESPDSSVSEKDSKLSLVNELRLNKEIESIEFYINQEYIDIAVKSLIALIEEFGEREEFAHLMRCLAHEMPDRTEPAEPVETAVQMEEDQVEAVEPEEEKVETADLEEEQFEAVKTEEFGEVKIEESNLPVEEEFAEPPTEGFHSSEPETFEREEAETIGSPEEIPPVQVEADVFESEEIQELDQKSVGLFEDFRSGLGLEEIDETPDESDYETHYQTGIAYQEMGLMEDAIKEFQNAINLIEINDGTRRFFQCSNLLGHCFMVKQMPTLAITWYYRAFETADLNEKEVQALNYELANSYESAEDYDKAIEYFEKIYAEDVEYRDINERLETLRGMLVGA